VSQSSANGVARTRPDALSSLAARLPDPQDREWFAQLVSYVDSLPPNDEFVKVAQLFGFLTLIGRELPETLAEERKQLRDMLSKAYTALQQEIKTNATYHEQLQQRLSQLPEEIAAGVRPADIAKAMSEAFRQQIAAIGLQDVKAVLSTTTTDLRQVARDLDAAVKPIAGRYGTLSDQIEKQASALDHQANRLLRAADALNKKNSELLQQVNSLSWYWYAAAGLVLLLLGGFCGVTWEHRNFGDTVSALQDQITHLQQSVKAASIQPAPAPGPAKKGKKN
jgi:hypothetical protein